MLGISEGCISSSPLHRVADKLQRTERDWLILKQTRGCAVDKDMVMMMMMPFISRLEGEKAQCGNWAENIKRSFNYEMMPTLECHHFLFSQPLASFFFLLAKHSADSLHHPTLWWDDCRQCLKANPNTTLKRLIMSEANMKICLLFWYAWREKSAGEATHIFVKGNWTFFFW